MKIIVMISIATCSVDYNLSMTFMGIRIVWRKKKKIKEILQFSYVECNIVVCSFVQSAFVQWCQRYDVIMIVDCYN